MTDVKKYEKRLRERLADLNQRMEEIERDLDAPVSPDVEERATEREGDEVLESLGNASLTEARMIEAALERIENGSFGICAECSEPISPERLDILPHTPRCKDCA